MQTPPDLPLFDGRMDCLTCHTDEARTDHRRRAVLDDPMLRRDPDAGGLCTSCHTPGAMRSSPHVNAMRAAHGFPLSDGGAGQVSSLDLESQSCMSCHDGTIASATGGHAASTFAYSASPEHPLGVEVRSRNTIGADQMLFVDQDMLDPRIRLFEGAVGCGSCHSVYSPEDDLLVMSNVASRLCLSCHDM